MAGRSNQSRLGPRFQEALWYAVTLHRGQYRKGTRIPYISHLLAVTGIVLEHGADEDVAIAALLHDAVEDRGGRETLRRIRRRFGLRVAEIVEQCSDTLNVRKPPWRRRKQAYLAHLLAASDEARLISLSDKLHNARMIVQDLRREGERVWRRFGGGEDGTLWYYRSLVDVFRRSSAPADLVQELARLVSRMHTLAGRSRHQHLAHRGGSRAD